MGSASITATRGSQRAVMQLHDSCNYRVKHKGHSGTFSMQKGVRQGCALSPYLYALFSCLICDTLAERTSPEWAAEAITLFVDDTHGMDNYLGPRFAICDDMHPTHVSGLS